jgi:Transglycosylase SLT domain
MDLVILRALGALALWAAPMHLVWGGLPGNPRPILVAQAGGAGEPQQRVASLLGDAGRPSQIDRWQTYIAEAAQRFSIPEAWIRAVMQAESGGQALLDGRPITSRTGARGLMQVMPGTYVEKSARAGLGSDPDDSEDNILAGTAYLRAMYDRFGYPGLFAAYNAGPEALGAYLRQGAPLPDETWRYLAAISPAMAAAIAGDRPSVTIAFQAKPANPSGSWLFFPITTVSEGEPHTSDQPSGGAERANSGRKATPNASLFVPLGTSRNLVQHAGRGQ